MKEFDEPYTLLQNRDSLFSLMVKNTGPGMAQQLREVAKKAYLKNADKKKGVNGSVFGGIGGDGDVIDMNGSVLRQVANGNLNSPNGQVSDTRESTEMTYL